jgi:hypothetical protein
LELSEQARNAPRIVAQRERLALPIQGKLQASLLTSMPAKRIPPDSPTTPSWGLSIPDWFIIALPCLYEVGDKTHALRHHLATVRAANERFTLHAKGSPTGSQLGAPLRANGLCRASRNPHQSTCVVKHYAATASANRRHPHAFSSTQPPKPNGPEVAHFIRLPVKNGLQEHH